MDSCVLQSERDVRSNKWFSDANNYGYNTIQQTCVKLEKTRGYIVWRGNIQMSLKKIFSEYEGLSYWGHIFPSYDTNPNGKFKIL